MKQRVLFVCTRNSARSQIAEGILRHLAKDRFEVFSAGSEPAERINPMAVKTLARMGIDISQQQPKSLKTFSRQKFDYVITVCDRARENCPSFSGKSKQLHWGQPDPEGFVGTAYEQTMFDSIASSLVMQICLEWSITLPTDLLLVPNS